MEFIPKILVSLFPVLLFLLMLVLLDTYQLVRFRSIIQTILMGGIIAILCLGLNNTILYFSPLHIFNYSRYVGPLVEEILKATFIIILLRGKKIGFLVDAAIYGFAVGTGFAWIENIYYLNMIERSNIFLWIIRGFGTAIMHGGTTAIFAILSVNYANRFAKRKFLSFLPGLLAAYIVHSFFNHFFLPPVIMTVFQLVVLSVLTTITFKISEKSLQEWLEAGMDVDVWLLDYINSGKVSQTKIGQYLHQLKNQFSGEVVADMLCYVRLHLELAIRAKGILMMRESGFQVPKDPEIQEKLTELKYLENSIGKTGKLALSPVLHTSIQELWQLELVEQK